MMQPRLPFLDNLNFPDITKLIKDPVFHDPNWPPVPTKLPSEKPKFKEKTVEDPGDHVTTFHLWCSSNSLNDYSIRLRLFQQTLIGVAVKWYIELLIRLIIFSRFGDGIFKSFSTPCSV